MNRIKFPLLLVALFGAATAFVSRPPQPSQTLHRYAFWTWDMYHSKMYYYRDLTQANYTKGLDYDCVPPVTICTFLADPSLSHSDFSGSWFYGSEIPHSGVDSSGTYFDLDM